jgi:adenosylcobinamide-GDP ribazoletransferase
MSETAAFFHAMRFLTVLPVPRREGLDADWLVRASKYFPAVGIIVGAASAVLLLAASHWWTGVVPATLAVAASVLLTGALHEDGLADAVDALGGRSRDARLAIMKDSRIGTYGALALGFTVLLRIAALSVLLPSVGAAALIASHGGARAAASLTMNALPYAGDVAAAKLSYSETRLDRSGVLVTIVTALLAMIPVFTVSVRGMLVGVIVASALAALVAAAARRLIGGYTGDILGAVEQVCEVGILLGIAAGVPH